MPKAYGSLCSLSASNETKAVSRVPRGYVDDPANLVSSPEHCEAILRTAGEIDARLAEVFAESLEGGGIFLSDANVAARWGCSRQYVHSLRTRLRQRLLERGLGVA